MVGPVKMPIQMAENFQLKLQKISKIFLLKLRRISNSTGSKFSRNSASKYRKCRKFQIGSTKYGLKGRCLAGRTAMHACQIGPTDIAPPCPGSPQRACVGTKGGTLWDRQPFCPISPLLLKGAVGATTLSLRFGIDQDLGISGLNGKLAAGCFRSGPTWIVFCFRSWFADGKNGGMARSGIGC